MCVCLLECGFKLNVCDQLDTHVVKYSLESHLTSALGAVVHRPLVSVLVHDAVMDADAVVDANAILYQLVLICL